MHTADHGTTVTIPTAWLVPFPVGGAILGGLLGLGVRPLVEWLLGLVDGAPAPLRLAAELPLPWAVAVLAVVGAALGAGIAGSWRAENPTVELTDVRALVRFKDKTWRVARADTSAVFSDGHDLVVLDTTGRETTRLKVEQALVGRLRTAFEHHGFPWRGADPRDLP
ncbi:YqeB family protein [Actinokineospora sp. G85]|uniref:YqeB family protein n=1 Tax=Actinokineospora sp. G85 TaxID=3406626 RepID=UPI003C716CA2